MPSKCSLKLPKPVPRAAAKKGTIPSAYGVKTSTEENRKGYPGFPTIHEQKSKLTMLEIGRVILNRSV
jgi:hypothetical protein